MSTIYLRHPVHGTKVATMDMEAKYDETLGWVRYNPETPSDAIEPEAVNALKRRRKTSE